MPYAVGLDTLGTDNPIVVDGIEAEGEHLEITWSEYQTAIDHLVNGYHVCVVDGKLVSDYVHDSGTKNTP